jgi:hypothetical protein
MWGGRTTPLITTDLGVFFEQDGAIEAGDREYFRGARTRFYPKDRSLDGSDPLAYFTDGLMPPQPFLDRGSKVVAFGSCFARHISSYLDDLGFTVSTRRESSAYISTMGDGIVHTWAIRQQFEWAWLGQAPSVALWHGYDSAALGYDETVRLESKALFDTADVFIITLGLSEVWYDEPTGEVFWRAVPHAHFDPARHKFRTLLQAENLQNIRAIHRLIRQHRPQAATVFTLSPIPLLATFRPVPAAVADAASKASLRSALDEFLAEAQPTDPRLFYFPSYEIALRAFERPYREDRRHVQEHVLDLNMAVFERYFCKTGLTDADLLARYRAAKRWDCEVMLKGKAAAPRSNRHKQLRPDKRPAGSGGL